MKYLIQSILFVLLSVIAGTLISRYILKGRKTDRKKRILVNVISCLVVLFLASAISLTRYSRAEQIALEECISDEKVTFVENEKYYSFISENDTALIFYPGGMIEEYAYSILARKIAEGGMDVYVLKVPLHLAFFARNEADEIIDGENYGHVYLAGHSLGGYVASTYAAKTDRKIEGLIIIGAYPGKKIDDDIALLTIYGDRDGVLSKREYEASRDKWPYDSKEIVIEGANHAGYACYGKQSGDNEAAIDRETQISICAKAIIEFVTEHNK